MSFFDKLKPLPKIIPSKDPKKAKFNISEFDNEFEEIDESELKKQSPNFLKNFLIKYTKYILLTLE